MTSPNTESDKSIDDLMETLADIEHQRWADWQAWCHKILRENCPSPELEKVLERWDKQIATPYKDLSEQEKQSDRDQVNRYLPIIYSLLMDVIGSAELEEVSGEQIPEAWIRNQFRLHQIVKLNKLFNKEETSK